MEGLKMMNAKKIQQDGFMCEAELCTKGKIYKALVNADPNYADEMVMMINDVRIDIEIDFGLNLRNVENYTNEQLAFASLDKIYGETFLTDFEFKMVIPVELIDIHNKKIIFENLEIKIKRTGYCGDYPINSNYQYRILNATYTECDCSADLEYVLRDMQTQLKDRYILRVCACCKYVGVNPFAPEYGCFYCFKKNKEEYSKYSYGITKSDCEKLINIADYTTPIINCDEFEPFSDK